MRERRERGRDRERERDKERERGEKRDGERKREREREMGCRFDAKDVKSVPELTSILRLLFLMIEVTSRAPPER